MANVHDLDHVKLDLGPTPSASGSAKPSTSTPTPGFGQANAKLEPFLLLAKNAKGAAAVRLIAEVTAAPGVYVFGELLDIKGIAELATSPEHAQHHALLEIFAYKTWKDYQEHSALLPKLTAAQEVKLKHLSIVSLASQSRVLPYPLLLETLSVPSARQLEDLIIEAIYADVIDGRLDQKHARFEVDSCMGRDVRRTAQATSADVDMTGAAETVAAGSVEELSKKLGKWSENVGAVLTQLDHYIAGIRADDARRTKTAEQHHDYLTQIVQDIQRSQKSQGAKDAGPASGKLRSLSGDGGIMLVDPQQSDATVAADGINGGEAMDLDVGSSNPSKMRSPPGPGRTSTRKRGRN